MDSHTISTQDSALGSVLSDLRTAVHMAWFSGSASPQITGEQQKSHAVLANVLHVLDALLVTRQLHDQLALDIEPINVGSVMADVAHRLYPYAKALDCSIDVVVASSQRPVIANRELLETALLALGSSVVTVKSYGEAAKGKPIVLAASSRANTVQLGMYAASLAKLEPVPSTFESYQAVSAGSAGVWVADMLMQRMAASFKQSSYQKTPGYAAALPYSPQLTIGGL